MDVEMLSRLQFAGTIMFHYLFPPLSIGLGLQLFLTELAFIRTKDPAWEAAARFWTKIFAVNFGLGVATGIVMEFEFGTNWAAYSRFVGDVFGSALAAEGIFAFFLESGFLAILVFGWDRVSPPVHLLSTAMVFLGSLFSAVWIVIANSWQQTPAGYHIVTTEFQGEPVSRAEITDFWAMVFNPSSMDRLAHTIIGALVMGAFFVASVSAFYLLKRRHLDVARKCLSIALPTALIATLASAASGHRSAQLLVDTQPAKLAAMEAHFKTEAGPTGLYLFGWPSAAEERVRFGIKVPYLLSLLVYNDLSTPVPGMDKIAPEDRPPIWLPFQTFHLMVGLGTAMILLAAISCVFLFRGTLETKRLCLWLLILSPLAAMAANQAGWVTAEVGRQPWVVYPSVQNGVPMMGLRTKDGLSESVTAEQVLASIVMFGIIYSALFFIWIYVLNSKIQHGPESPKDREPKSKDGSPPEDSASMKEQFAHHATSFGGPMLEGE